MRTVIIGQAPSQHSDPRRPLLGGHSGAKLQELCGFNLRQYFEAFDRANLIKSWPGCAAGGKGDAFPAPEAQAAAHAMLPALFGRRVVLLGRGVAEAFGLRAPPLEWTRLPCPGGWLEAAYLPHPSGINRWWNTKANTSAAADFLRAEGERGLQERRQRVAAAARRSG